MKEARRVEGGGKKGGTQEMFFHPPIYRNINSSLFPNSLTFQHVRNSLSLQTKPLTQISKMKNKFSQEHNQFVLKMKKKPNKCTP